MSQQYNEMCPKNTKANQNQSNTTTKSMMKGKNKQDDEDESGLQLWVNNYKLLKRLNRKCAKLLNKEIEMEERVDKLTLEMKTKNNESVSIHRKYLISNAEDDVRKSKLISQVCGAIDDSLNYASYSDQRLHEFENKLRNIPREIVEQTQKLSAELNKSSQNTQVKQSSDTFNMIEAVRIPDFNQKHVKEGIYKDAHNDETQDQTSTSPKWNFPLEQGFPVQSAETAHFQESANCNEYSSSSSSQEFLGVIENFEKMPNTSVSQKNQKDENTDLYGGSFSYTSDFEFSHDCSITQSIQDNVSIQTHGQSWRAQKTMAVRQRKRSGFIKSQFMNQTSEDSWGDDSSYDDDTRPRKLQRIDDHPLAEILHPESLYQIPVPPNQ